MTADNNGPQLAFDDRGLITAIVQHAETSEVLMLAHMNLEAYRRTLAGPNVWFYSRSRDELWEKGATSGNYLRFVDAKLDCDGDAILITALPDGPSCHTGKTTCFHVNADATASSITRSGPGILTELESVIRQRARDLPDGSYTADLLRGEISRVAQKVIEEAGETALAASTGAPNVAEELADLLYHCLVLLRAADIDLDEVWRELAKRRR